MITPDCDDLNGIIIVEIRQQEAELIHHFIGYCIESCRGVEPDCSNITFLGKFQLCQVVYGYIV
jgi:hypothetical protein